ncbi:RNA 2',3'-cyclic phosphodiesterase [Actinocorallia longicatena]|uniref:RNA 2',3'-cyclic phosphodiesterase n=1 Tax=Actinocorallia longicatena TaxID=111803 RepID=A0ABP6Q603_9ACTN
MRLFAALVPPAEILDELDAYTAPLRKEWPELRWAGRELWHVTVAFYGETDERSYERLLPRLQRSASRTPVLNLSFAGAGAFPGGGVHARVVWTGVYGDRRPLAQLAASLAATGRRAGAPDPKPFRPHLTLARCRVPTDVRTLTERLASFAGRPWQAASVALIHSQMPRAAYETLTSYPLSG